jgi:hypothetical protein
MDDGWSKHTVLFAQGNMRSPDFMHPFAQRDRDLWSSLVGTYGVRKVLGSNHPETCDQLNQKGHTKLARGHLFEAEKFFNQAWEGRKDSLGSEHPLTLQSLRQLALVQKRCGWTDASQEILHRHSCHGFSTRHPITSREHAASVRCLGTSLKAVGRLTPLEKTLSSSMAPGRSSRAGSLTYTAARKQKCLATKRSNSEGALDVFNDAAHAKGRRLDEETAEVLLREFALVLFRKYGCCEKAFKDFDLNGNGTLSSSEFTHHARDLFAGDATALFKALDFDR